MSRAWYEDENRIEPKARPGENLDGPLFHDPSQSILGCAFRTVRAVFVLVVISLLLWLASLFGR